ncbi:hypothetical protein KG112_02410 [Nocardioides sp. zg-ZUI104]|uniref:hypothetical protein n=1 Tax=Nocardioides faecalis TaxID=2803858 RepID=UPI001BCCDB48|nr:hypothetical protein [Nocardioides faecalis]MBS4751659.1 hypothetical protein [Nocardioides faecalis]
MRAADDMPAEFTGPVAHSSLWLWLAVALAVLVVAYYVLSWWLTRPPRPPKVLRVDVDTPGLRAVHLSRLDALVAQVQAGELSARDGHQGLSEVVRSYVASVTTLPARSMALADFRSSAPPELTEAIELMYPPEFAPDDAIAAERFADAVAHARRLVSTWG